MRWQPVKDILLLAAVLSFIFIWKIVPMIKKEIDVDDNPRSHTL